MCLRSSARGTPLLTANEVITGVIKGKSQEKALVWVFDLVMARLHPFIIRANRTKDLETLCWRHFTILKRNDVEDFLNNLNTQQPTIRFTMEAENDNTIPFLDTLVIKDSEGRLTTSVYRKPTHTDQYLSYDSHYPQSVKHGVVKCLNDRSYNIINIPSVISE